MVISIYGEANLALRQPPHLGSTRSLYQLGNEGSQLYNGEVHKSLVVKMGISISCPSHRFLGKLIILRSDKDHPWKQWQHFSVSRQRITQWIDQTHESKLLETQIFQFVWHWVKYHVACGCIVVTVFFRHLRIGWLFILFNHILSDTDFCDSLALTSTFFCSFSKKVGIAYNRILEVTTQKCFACGLQLQSISMSLKNENVSKASSYDVPDLLPKTHKRLLWDPPTSNFTALCPLRWYQQTESSRCHSWYLLKSWITDDDQILQWSKISGIIILYDFLLMIMSTLLSTELALRYLIREIRAKEKLEKCRINLSVKPLKLFPWRRGLH